MKSLQEQIIERPFSCIPRWATLWMISEIVKLPPNSKVLEMGTYVGGTTRLIALANPDIEVHTVELDLLNPDNSHMTKHLIEHYGIIGPVDLEYIQECHVGNIPNVIRHIGDSSSIDIQDVMLVFIDANHTEKGVYLDLQKAWDITADGGFIFGDDINSPYVYNAVCRFAAEHDIPYTIYSKLFKMQKLNEFNYLRNISVEEINRFTHHKV